MARYWSRNYLEPRTDSSNRSSVATFHRHTFGEIESLGLSRPGNKWVTTEKQKTNIFRKEETKGRLKSATALVSGQVFDVWDTVALFPLKSSDRVLEMKVFSNGLYGASKQFGLQSGESLDPGIPYKTAEISIPIHSIGRVQANATDIWKVDYDSYWNTTSHSKFRIKDTVKIEFGNDLDGTAYEHQIPHLSPLWIEGTGIKAIDNRFWRVATSYDEASKDNDIDHWDNTDSVVTIDRNTIWLLGEIDGNVRDTNNKYYCSINRWETNGDINFAGASGNDPSVNDEHARAGTNSGASDPFVTGRELSACRVQSWKRDQSDYSTIIGTPGNHITNNYNDYQVDGKYTRDTFSEMYTIDDISGNQTGTEFRLYDNDGNVVAPASQLDDLTASTYDEVRSHNSKPDEELANPWLHFYYMRTLKHADISSEATAYVSNAGRVTRRPSVRIGLYQRNADGSNAVFENSVGVKYANAIAIADKVDAMRTVFNEDVWGQGKVDGTFAYKYNDPTYSARKSFTGKTGGLSTRKENSILGSVNTKRGEPLHVLTHNTGIDPNIEYDVILSFNFHGVPGIVDENGQFINQDRYTHAIQNNGYPHTDYNLEDDTWPHMSDMIIGVTCTYISEGGD